MRESTDLRKHQRRQSVRAKGSDEIGPSKTVSDSITDCGIGQRDVLCDRMSRKGEKRVQGMIVHIKKSVGR